MIIANDATVKAGAFFPMTCKKVLRAQRIAMENRLPLVYLVDSAGVFLPLQDEVFPDEDDFGRIFRNNASSPRAASRNSPPSWAIASPAAATCPSCAIKLLMTEGSGLYLAGPALVKAAIGQTVSHEELGGAAMHASVSGTIDYREKDDPSCIEPPAPAGCGLPATSRSRLPGETSGPGPARHAGPPKGEYDVRDLLKSILDDAPFDEYKAEYGQTLVCGFGRLGGSSRRHRGEPAEALQAGRRPAAIRRRDLRRQRRQSGPVHHGLQPDRARR